MILSFIRYGFIAITALTISCVQHVTQGGGGSEVEVVGCVIFSDGKPAPGTQVKLIPQGYNAETMNGIGDSLIDTSDAHGFYTLKIPKGIYNMQAVQLSQRTRLLITGINVENDTTIVKTDFLQRPGTIRLFLPKGLSADGYAYIPGTEIAVSFTKENTDILLDSIPAATVPEVRLVIDGDTTSNSKLNVVVSPGDTTIVANISWSYLKRIFLNTSASGANIAGDVYGFPVLVKLSSNSFDFSQAKAGGADLRFTSSYGNSLSYEIEKWDADAKSAAIWVKVDTIHGNDSTQSIIMYWGNSNAAEFSNSMAVFDTAAGFQGVWHLGESGNDSAHDATANRFNGVAYHMSGTSPVAGTVGNARAFDGDSSYLRMPNTATSKLNFPEDGYFTISAWVYADTLDRVYRTILTKGYEQYFLQLSYFPGDKPLWQFSVFKESATWNMSQNTAVEKQWVLLTAVRQGTAQSLYCNGELIAQTSAVYPHPDTTILRNTSNDFSVGRFLQEATYPTRFGYCYFKGKIDEVRACSVAWSSDWIKLSYMNQRSDDKLVQFK